MKLSALELVRDDRINRAVLMNVELRVLHAALVRYAAGKLTVMIEEVPVIADLNNGVMRGPAEYGLHDAALISERAVRLLALCVAEIVRGSGGVNLVMPEKFSAITNGITHRRWLMSCNPELTELICDSIGTGWIKDPQRLSELRPFADDAAFREKFGKIKQHNKVRLAEMMKERQGAVIDPSFIYDVQAKRLHEYKRQMLNALHILVLYNRIVNEDEVSRAKPSVEMIDTVDSLTSA